MINANYRKILIIIFISSCLTKLCFILYQHNYDDIEKLKSTSGDMIEIGMNIADGKGFSATAFNLHGSIYYKPEIRPTTYMAPIYPYIIAFCVTVFGKNGGLLAIEIMQALFSSALSFTIYSITIRIFKVNSIALLASIMVAFYPSFVYFSTIIWSSMLFIFLITVLILLLMRMAERPDLINAIVCGFLTGFTLLVDPVLLPFCIFTIIWLFFNFTSDKVFIIKRISVTVLLGAITISPWMVRNYLVFGKLTFIKSNIGYNFFVGNNPQATGSSTKLPVTDYTEVVEINKAMSKMNEAETNKYFLNKTFLFIKNNPAQFIKLSLQKFKNYWWIVDNKLNTSERMERYIQIMYFTYGIPLFLSIFGIFLSRKKTKYCSMIWLIFFSFSMVYSITHSGNYRYRLPAELFILMFASVAIMRSFELTKEGFRKLSFQFSTKNGEKY